MEYIKVAETTSFSTKNKILVHLGKKEILLTKVGNDYYAIDNKCPHMGGSLYEGDLVGSEIICPKHHTRFDTRTGKVVDNGKVLFIKLGVKDTTSYPIKLEDNTILIGIEPD